MTTQLQSRTTQVIALALIATSLWTSARAEVPPDSTLMSKLNSQRETRLLEAKRRIERFRPVSTIVRSGREGQMEIPG